MEKETEEAIRGRLQDLPGSDKAVERANPFAIHEGRLVTADEVAASGKDQFFAGFSCPKCTAEMRHFTSKKGTPFFAHVNQRGNCRSGYETPVHLCIKRGMMAVGFSCEHKDGETGFQFDAYHAATGTAVEVIRTGEKRYARKIASMKADGRPVWWVLDSGSRALATAAGSEIYCLESARNGTVAVSGLFNSRGLRLIESIGQGNLFAFYMGLIWYCDGGDRWLLLDENHDLSVAATSDGGMKHLMVLMHQENAITRIENARRGINRDTWFDRTWRYRCAKGQTFDMTWRGDREYVLGMVRNLIETLDSQKPLKIRPWKSSGSKQAAEARHWSEDEIISRISTSHSASLDEIIRLRAIVEIASKANAQEVDAVSTSPSPFVMTASDQRQATVPKREIRSSRWDAGDGKYRSRAERQRIEKANRALLEAANDRGSPGSVAYYLNGY